MCRKQDHIIFNAHWSLYVPPAAPSSKALTATLRHTVHTLYSTQAVSRHIHKCNSVERTFPCRMSRNPGKLCGTVSRHQRPTFTQKLAGVNFIHTIRSTCDSTYLHKTETCVTSFCGQLLYQISNRFEKRVSR